MDYLFLLQQFREGYGAFLIPVMVIISEIAYYVAPVIVAVVYWAFDKRLGTYMMLNTFGGSMLSHTIKLTACVNRPWIRDSRLHIASAVQKSSSGYSFPSGHTTMAATTYGTLALHMKKKKAIVIALMCMILLTAFARNFLGAHTLEDVLAAIVLSFVVIFANSFIMKKLDENPKFDLVVLIGGILICIVVVLYIFLKNYPMDVNEAGELLVDPLRMRLDGIEAAGFLGGGIIGWFIERRFINFEIPTQKKEKIVRIVVGIACFAILYLWVLKLLEKVMLIEIAKFLKCFITVFFATAIYPAGIKFFTNRKKSS